MPVLAPYSPKRYIESGGGGREAKRLATHINSKTAVNIPVIATANATDLATAQALANANKVTINNLLVALQNAGIML